jgi:hypothetical protein
MADIKEIKDAKLDFSQELDLYDRREQDRRRESSEGYAYVSTVGWICRREKIRRKDDPFDFFS